MGAEGPRRLPDFGSLALPPAVAELVAEARAGGDWGAFVTRWAERLAPARAASAP